MESDDKLRQIYLKNKTVAHLKEMKQKTQTKKIGCKNTSKLSVLPEKHQGERESVWERNTTRATIIVKDGKAWFEKKTREENTVATEKQQN